MIEEFVVGKVLEQLFGDQIEKTTDATLSYMKKWFRPLTKGQKNNIQYLTSKSKELPKVSYIDLPPSAVVLTLEWIEMSKNHSTKDSPQIGECYVRALDGILKGNYDLMNAVRALPKDALVDLESAGTIKFSTATEIETCGMGQLSNPLAHDLTTRPSLLIFLIASFSLLTVVALIFSLNSGAVLILMVVMILGQVWLISLIAREQKKKKNENNWIHRILFSDRRRFWLNSKGKYILYDLFPKTYLTEEHGHVYGERFLDVSIPEINKL